MSDKAEMQIVEGVLEAILAGRLRAGTKLSEPALCDIYGCSRSTVRRALVILATRKIIELQRNRGAFVRIPCQAEAHNVFQARRAIEKTLARNAAQSATQRDLAELDAVVEAESHARKGSDRAKAIRLSGEFHLVLAKIGQNEVLAEFLRELVMRSSLIVGFFAGSNHVLCQDDEHAGIASAIRQGDGAKASELIENHLRHIEGQLVYEPRSDADDLRQALRA